MEEATRITKLPGWPMWLLRKILPGIAFAVEVAKYLAAVATAARRRTTNMAATMRRELCDHLYFRLNVPGVGGFKLDSYAQIKTISGQTTEYLAK